MILNFNHHAHRAEQTYKQTSTYQHSCASCHYANNTWTDRGHKNLGYRWRCVTYNGSCKRRYWRRMVGNFMKRMISCWNRWCLSWRRRGTRMRRWGISCCSIGRSWRGSSVGMGMGMGMGWMLVVGNWNNSKYHWMIMITLTTTQFNSNNHSFNNNNRTYNNSNSNKANTTTHRHSPNRPIYTKHSTSKYCNGTNCSKRLLSNYRRNYKSRWYWMRDIMMTLRWVRE